MHTEAITTPDDFTDAHREYFADIKIILSDEQKYERFRQMTPLPLPTTALCDSIYQEYPRVLRAYNKYIKNTFSTEELEIDFKEYCEQLGFNDFWETQGMEALKKNINSFVVVDLPRIQKAARPEPYMYFLHIDHVIDVEVRRNRQVAEYIAFHQDITPDEESSGIIARAIVIDDQAYRYFIQTKESGSNWVQEGTDIPHYLPECPAFKFYADLVNEQKNRLNSLSPITTSLGDLADYNTAKVSTKYYKMYGMFPIYWGYKIKCGYIDQATGAQCNGEGSILYYDINGIDSKPSTKPCPKCASRKIMGPGSFMEVDPPVMKDQADLREPIGYVGVDVDALKYAKEDLSTMRNELVYHTTGKMSIETQSKEALNEMDVRRQFEGRLNVLLTIKKNFELAIYYAYSNIARLRYGVQYLNTVVDLGNEFFLQSESELNKEYQEIKTAGRPSYELTGKREFIMLTKYHNNPDELARLNILQNLEPYQDYGVGELKGMGIPLVDPVGFLIKVNFPSLLKRFERENMPILQFGAALSFAKKIETIFLTLKTYIDEQLQKNDPGGGPFAPKTGGEEKRPGSGN